MRERAFKAFDETDLVRTGDLLRFPRHADRAAAGQLLVGVNTRNLRTLDVDAARLTSLAPLLPKGATWVAESGLRDAQDVVAARKIGYDIALVGSALMRSGNPGALLSDMLAAGRAA